MNLEFRITPLLLLFLFFLINHFTFAQADLITIDENFADWNSSMVTYTDGADNPNGLDILDLQVTNDQHHLYVKFTLSNEIALADDLVPHRLWLCIDADNNPNTGYLQQAEYGTELAINFNQHYAWFNQPNNNIQVGFGVLGLRQAPTVTSNTFEVAIPRNVMPDNANPVFTQDTIRILLKDDVGGDELPNIGEVFQYVFTADTVAASTPISLEKEDPSFIRAVSYNVLFNNGWEQPGISHTEQMVKALKADLYCFQEADNITPQEVKTYMDTWVPTGTQEGWYVSRDYSKITCTRWAQLSDSVLIRAHALLIDLPDNYGTDLMLINGHLSCCSRNQERQNQADDVAAFILDATTAGGNIELPQNTPILFMGDMNLVGYNQQRKTILTGDIQDINTFGQGGLLDWDSTSLKDAVPLHINQNMAYTWRSFSGTTFPHGRLDYQFYTDAVIQKEKAFVLQTEVLPKSYLTQYGLDSANTRISDHFPVVVDYSIITETVGIESEKNNELSFSVYPNPASETVSISANGIIEVIQLQNMSGTDIEVTLQNKNTLDLSSLASGLYILNVIIDGKHYQEKLVLKK